MKKLVYQYFTGSSTYHEKSAQSLKAYAERLGAEYRLYNNRVPLSKYYGTFAPFFDLSYKNYDVMFYADSDILATTNCENVFDCMEENKIGIHHMAMCPYVLENKRQDVIAMAKAYEISQWFDKGHGNAGTVLFPSSVYEDFCSYIETLNLLNNIASKRAALNHLPFGGYDQYVINQFNANRGDNTYLPWIFNYHLNQYDHDKRTEATLIHYHGGNKKLLHEDFEQPFILK